jgi:membrane protein required for colicin V production
VILVILCYTIIHGLKKGMMRQVLGLGSVILGCSAAVMFYEPVAGLFSDTESFFAKTASFIAIFFICKSADSILAWIKRDLFRHIKLSWMNRTVGALLGLLKGLVIVLFIAVILLTVLPDNSGMLTESVTLPYIAALPLISSRLVPEGIRIRYNEKVEKLKNLRDTRS